MRRKDNYSPAVIKLVWFSMIFALAIYAFVVFFVTSTKKDVPPFNIEAAFKSPLLAGLFIAAVAVVWTAFAVPKIAGRDTAGDTPIVPAAAAPLQIAQFAMIEAAAIFGVVAAIIDQHWQVFVPFLALSLGGFLGAFPSGEGTGSENAGGTGQDG